MKSSKLLRGGRIKSTDKDIVKYTSSAIYDRKLLKHIIEINKAHVTMLKEQHIISKKEASKLISALKEINVKRVPKTYEDAHLFIEEKVIEKIGSEIGGNLHIGKSRNDQVSTAIRMELREELLELVNSVLNFQQELINQAKKNTNTLIIAYTHLQPAQPVTFSHYLLSYFDAFQRDLNRLIAAFHRVNKSPMGAAALATTSFPINRKRVAELLGFDGIIENSLDAIGTRDFILEVLAHLTIMSININRLVEDFILWSSYDFKTIELPLSFYSTSSIMPQKKNPDLLEVIRARTTQIAGNFMTALMTLKGLPSVYNLDYQEVTPIIWNSIKTLKQALFMLTKLTPYIEVRDSSKKAIESFSTVTELANLLVSKYQVSFRISHKIVGTLVKKMIDEQLSADQITSDLLAEVTKKISNIELEVKEEDIKRTIDPTEQVQRYTVIGGPSPMEVKRMTKERMKQLQKNISWVKQWQDILE